MRNTIIFFLSLLLFAGLCLAQPSLVWQRALGGSGSDGAHSIEQTSDGGFIVAGHSYSNDGDVSGNHGYNDYWVVNLNSAGDIIWQKCLGGSYEDYAYSIQQTSDGGYIVAGWSGSNDGDVSGNHGNHDYWVVKLNSAGAIEWQRALGGSGTDEAFSIQQTSDGGFIVAGYSYSNDGNVSGWHEGYDSYGSPTSDYWVVKLNSAGAIVWQRALGGNDKDVARSIQQTTDGGYIVAGYSESNDGDVSGNHGGVDSWIVKLNSAGALVWQKCLGGSSGDYAYSIQQTSDGGFIVAGVSYSNDGDVSGWHGSWDSWVVKLNSAGALVWQKCLGGSSDDWAYSIQQPSDGGFIVAGVSYSNDGDVSGWHGSWDSWVVKLNSAGALVWQKCLGGSYDDEAFSIQQTSDGGFIVAGYSESNDGDVSGHHGVYDDTDYWVVKLSSDFAISEKGLPEQFAMSAYPNPFNSSCEITAPIGADVEIYNLRGNVVATPYPAGAGFVPLDKGDRDRAERGFRGFVWQPDQSISSGIYLVRARTEDGRTTTKRIVYLK